MHACEHTQDTQKSGLPSAVLGEVLSLPDLRGSKDTTAVRNAAEFLEALAAAAPRFMHANRMVLLPLLNCKCYSIRNAVITTLGRVCSLSAEAEEDDDEAASGGGGGGAKAGDDADAEKDGDKGGAMDKASRDMLLDLLLERAHDVSA